jgi:hypothetical protein
VNLSTTNRGESRSCGVAYTREAVGFCGNTIQRVRQQAEFSVGIPEAVTTAQRRIGESAAHRLGVQRSFDDFFVC